MLRYTCECVQLLLVLTKRVPGTWYQIPEDVGSCTLCCCSVRAAYVRLYQYVQAHKENRTKGMIRASGTNNVLKLEQSSRTTGVMRHEASHVS